MTTKAEKLAEQLKERHGSSVLSSQAAAELRRLAPMEARVKELEEAAKVVTAQYASIVECLTFSKRTAIKDLMKVLGENNG